MYALRSNSLGSFPLRTGNCDAGSSELRLEVPRVGLQVIASSRIVTEEVLRRVIHARAERRKFFPEHLFADPAWDMLLDLYHAHVLSKRVSVSSLCSASNAPATTGLRWIKTLEQEGLVDRTPDPLDGRRHFISLSTSGLECMDGFFESLAPRPGPTTECA
jgi:DNA-binding MarR family transcriptional regulator